MIVDRLFRLFGCRQSSRPSKCSIPHTHTRLAITADGDSAPRLCREACRNAGTYLSFWDAGQSVRDPRRCRALRLRKLFLYRRSARLRCLVIAGRSRRTSHWGVGAEIISSVVDRQQVQALAYICFAVTGSGVLPSGRSRVHRFRYGSQVAAVQADHRQGRQGCVLGRCLKRWHRVRSFFVESVPAFEKSLLRATWRADAWQHYARLRCTIVGAARA